MIIDKNKKGTIILSHYRSGGTQLKSIILNVIGDEFSHNYIGEINFDETQNNLIEQFESQMLHEDGIYDIILLNNPVVISFLYSTNRFEKLKEEYIDKGLVKFEHHAFPLDLAALNAEVIIRCNESTTLNGQKIRFELLTEMYKKQNKFCNSG